MLGVDLPDPAAAQEEFTMLLAAPVGDVSEEMQDLLIAAGLR